MAQTMREPDSDVLELKNMSRDRLRKRYNMQKNSHSRKTQNVDSDKHMTDDASSMTSGGAHVRSV